MAKTKAQAAPNQQPTLTLRKPQIGLQALLDQPIPNVLAAGSSRVGKSWLYMINIIMWCRMFPGLRVGIFRRNRNACDANLFKLTLIQALKATGMLKFVDLNKSDLTCTFRNQSVITFNGLDENQRDKILGSEFQVIWMNEVSEFMYDDVEFLKGRLYGKVSHKDNPDCFFPRRMLFDCNPDTYDDWDYKLFEQRIHPTTNKALQAPEDYAYHRLVTDDPEYIRQNIDQSDEWKERFIHARWQASNPDAIFNKAIINKHRRTWFDIPTNEDGTPNLGFFRRIVVSIDPAVTMNAKSDLTGIIVAGIDENGEAWILHDASGKYHPQDWAKKAIELFDKWEADLIVAEVNQGGDLVEQNLRQVRRNVPYIAVRATRGKEVRAEPVASAYREGKVHHVGDDLGALEMEMCAYGGERKGQKSPDRMDAMVWAIYQLLDIAGQEKDRGITAVRQSGFFR